MILIPSSSLALHRSGLIIILLDFEWLTQILQIPTLVIGTKLDLAEEVRAHFNRRPSQIAEECGADEIFVVIFNQSTHYQLIVNNQVCLFIGLHHTQGLRPRLELLSEAVPLLWSRDWETLLQQRQTQPVFGETKISVRVFWKHNQPQSISFWITFTTHSSTATWLL